MVAGPAPPAPLVAFAGGPGAALLFDAATFAVIVTCCCRSGPGCGDASDEAVAGRRLLTGLRGGWREVRSRSWVLAFLAGLAAYHAVVLPSVYALGPVLAERDLGGAGAWAVITVGFGAGSILGQMLLLRWRPSRPMLAAAVCLTFASTQAAIIGSGLPVAAIAVLEGVAAIAVQGAFTLFETSIQEQVPDRRCRAWRATTSRRAPG